MQVKKQQVELDTEQQTGSKSWKEYIKPVYCHPAYLTYMQSISRNVGLEEAQTGIKIVFVVPGKISIASEMQMTPPLWQKVENT